MSTQPPPHSICPAPEQTHDPALQLAPAGHAISQPPQLSASFPFVATQAPREHSVVPGAQFEPHTPALQTSPAWQTVAQLPQWVASDETQAPLHASSPARHWHELFWQLSPVPHVLPHAPQFCESELPFTHADPQEICCAPQVGGAAPPVPIAPPVPVSPPVPMAPPEPDGVQPAARKT